MPKKQLLTIPRVSIVMPAYNAEQFIGEVISTILSQTFKDFELIIVDDGSTDDTAAVIKQYSSIDSRIKYYHQKNKGSARLADTINIGISKSNAPLIARADSDDPWFLDKLQRQIDFMNKNPEYVIIGGAAEVTDERGQHLYTLIAPIDHEDHIRSMTLYTTLAHGSVMFTRDAFNRTGGYKNLHAVEDLDLWQRMSDEGKVYSFPEPLFKYRKNTQGISMSNWWIQGQELERLGDNFFDTHTPSVLDRRVLSKKLAEIDAICNERGAPSNIALETKLKLLDDNRRIAKKFKAKGMTKKWIRQYLAVALSSKLGLKLTVKSIVKSAATKVKQLISFKN